MSAEQIRALDAANGRRETIRVNHSLSHERIAWFRARFALDAAQRMSP